MENTGDAYLVGCLRSEDRKESILNIRREYKGEDTGPIYKKKVVIDVDATLADTHTATLNIYNARHGTHFTSADITDWDFSKTRTGLDYTSFMELYEVAWSHPETIKPFFEKKLMADLSEHYEIIIASKRPDSTIPYLNKWLESNASGIKYTLVIYSSNGKSDKHEYGADFMVDDNPGAAAEVRSGTFLLLVNRPYTPEYMKSAKDSKYTVVKDVNDAMRKMIDLAENRLSLAELRSGEKARGKSGSA